MTTVVSAFTLVARVLLVTAEETSVESASILRRLGYLCLGSWKPKLPVSHDREYLRHFGWLSARFRQDRWWWFAPWLCYEFVRACILGGAMSNPLGQVVSSLTLEVVLLVFGSIMRPFEATRLNILGIYLLGASKVVTLAISVAFLPEFAIARIPATVLGILIIIVQGGLALTAIAFILVGCVSTHWSSRAQKSSCEDAVQAPPTSSASDGYFASEYLARINAQLQQSQASSAADLSDQSAISSIKS
ncbi:hypothetical protein KEM52_002141 [Ascosphaera acerosa]|nr:hypothetical protein KEM52_002141 [Ascosphaera acerosa]